ncbi:MAG: methyltransferase domain-containing protein [Alphaproteobacteria bacterium]|nr:methyltransferase domain-containing protein [Alphaproteobacteria bacterium]MDA8031784.1 methyltransferase domain-containing protein [Alphaproteobacteria bacterium]
MKWNVNTYSRNAPYVPQYGETLLAMLAPEPGEDILDLGCGEGSLTEKIARLGCNVVGVDSSEPMVRAARQRGLDALVVAGENLDFADQFDAVFSNAALHWMKSADKVVENVYRALRDDGRFCAELGARGNVGTIIAAVYRRLAGRNLDGDDYNPWYFPSKDEYCARLREFGFVVESVDLFRRPTPLVTGIEGWLETFAVPFLEDIPQSEHGEFVREVVAEVEGALKDKDGRWFADYVRLRFLARKGRR